MVDPFFKNDNDWMDFYDPIKTDPRLRAFVLEAKRTFPDHDWVITSARRHPIHGKSGHNWEILSAVDVRSRTWTMVQITEFYDWYSRWWQSAPPMIDVIVEDGRFNNKYKDKPPHIHIEIDKPFWKIEEH